MSDDRKVEVGLGTLAVGSKMIGLAVLWLTNR